MVEAAEVIAKCTLWQLRKAGSKQPGACPLTRKQRANLSEGCHPLIKVLGDLAEVLRYVVDDL